MFRSLSFLSVVSSLLVALTGCQSPPQAAAVGPSAATATTPESVASNAYLFGWGDVPTATADPRGGTSRGTPVTLAPAQALPPPGIASATSALERDRAAILSLAGNYKVSFHFLETLGLYPEHDTPRPYHSWATEQVRVLAADGRFISLQHTLVMFMREDDGGISEPILVKHWRQDWTYEPSAFHIYRGDRTWARRIITPAEAAGAWVQTVWQVDDSPRYAALGRWTHDGNRSMWTGENAWRPLPRREHSVRHDYDVMEGFHRIVLTPTGWLHEQNNWKRVAGDASAVSDYRAHEIGLDRYERITAPALTAADDYWAKTGAYWAAVRAAWTDTLTRHERLKVLTQVDGERLFEAHFEYANDLADNLSSYDEATATVHAYETVRKFVRPLEP